MGCCAIEKTLKLLSIECVERVLNLNRLRLAFHEDSGSCVVEITEVKILGKIFSTKNLFSLSRRCMDTEISFNPVISVVLI